MAIGLLPQYNSVRRIAAIVGVHHCTLYRDERPDGMGFRDAHLRLQAHEAEARLRRKDLVAGAKDNKGRRISGAYDPTRDT